MFQNKKIAQYLVPGSHVHLVGIGLSLIHI